MKTSRPNRTRNMVIKGTLKFKQLPMPAPIKGKNYITPQKIKESAFQLFENQIDAYDTTIFWDLCAGSGQMGIEALSRGALFCTFCDVDANRLGAIRGFLKEHTLTKAASFYRGDGTRVLQTALQKAPPALELEPANLQIAIYADPPYDYSQNHIYKRLIENYNQFKEQCIYAKSILLIQAPKKIDIDAALNVKVYDYGKNQLLLAL